MNSGNYTIDYQSSMNSGNHTHW